MAQQQQVAARRALNGALHARFKRRFEQHGIDRPCRAHVAAGDQPAQVHAHQFGQRDGVGLFRRPGHQAFEDRAQVADGHAFLQQAAQHVGDALQRHHPGQFHDQVRRIGLHHVDHRLHVLDAEQRRRMLLDHGADVHGQHFLTGQRAYALRRRRVAGGRGNPYHLGERAEGHADFGLALVDTGARAGLQQPLAGAQHAGRRHHVLHADGVGVALGQRAMRDPQTGEHHAEVRLHLALGGGHALLELAQVDAAAQGVVQLQRQRRGHGSGIGVRAHLRIAHLDPRNRAGAARGAAHQQVAAASHHNGHDREGPFREARHHQEHGDGQPRHHQRLRLAQQLPANHIAKVQRAGAVLVRGDPRDDHAGRNGDQQRRDLRHHAVADGQDGVALERLADAHVPHQRTDADAGQDVDQRDHHAGDGVALDELHRAIHRAMQLAFLLQPTAAVLRLGGRDGAGTHVGVDAHLLARHGVQREPRPHFRHALRALGDDDELHDGDDQEHHAAHHHIVADDELAEGVDDVACIGVQQDQLGRGDIERQPEQRGEQQQRRERGQRQRGRNIGGHDQQRQAHAQVDREQEVEQERGQRQHEQRDHREQQQRQCQI
ncbi:hypothetical protein D3C72_1025500 [compost metagenome]